MSEAKPQLPLNVGQRLKVRRKELGVTLAQVELDTKIRGKFLTQLESGDYSKLSNDIYTRGFVQQYATYLGVSGQLMAEQYVSERGGAIEAETRAPRIQKTRRLIVTGRLVGLGISALIVTSVVGYLVLQFSSLAAAPRLFLSSPSVDATIDGSSVRIAGNTTPGSDVSVNDTLVPGDANGQFSDTLALQDGINVIRISSRSKLGKTTLITRNIIAHLPKIEQQSSLAVPAAPFGGVAVLLSVRGGTTGIVVTVDGKEAFRGIFADGTTKLFPASGVAQDIQVTTGNAGITSVTVTNSTVANKVLGLLGKAGEIRHNQDFGATTVFP
jgi:cytoskeletal protein RodZ